MLVAGVAEPPERERIERLLATVPALRERLAGLRAADAHDDGPVWHLPPPREGALRGRLGRAPVMDAGGGGAWVNCALDVDPERLAHHVVVLERQGARWEVVSPGEDEPGFRVADLPRRDGVPTLALVAPDGPGRVAVVLVPPDRFPEPGPPDRWVEVRRALADGDLAALSFDPNSVEEP